MNASGRTKMRNAEGLRPEQGRLDRAGRSKLPRRRKSHGLHKGLLSFALVLTGLVGEGPLHAQGVLTVTPGRTIATNAGSGSVGFSGDGGPAGTAQLARPSGTAYDTAGDLFLADANNHVIREITPGGTITTVAGTGVAGYGGDGGPANTAFLDTPTSVAIDPGGNLYIADSHNHRIREVSGGTITTVAGTGTPGFSGDGGTATSAQLALPSAVALDASGNLYIADTNNQRIRKIATGTITTVAGNGEELFAGDGGAATAASLDQPTGVAVDTAGNLYIADKNNHRVRVVNSAGMISTLAGSGAPSFAGAFGGDGASATAATLAKPVGIAVDGSANVYVADTNNQRIRQISADGVIATVAGTGDQGFGGDSGPATAAILNSPRNVGTDASGNLVIADTRNQRLRAGALGYISFGGQAVGTVSASQSITLSNSGTASLTVSSVSSTGPFALAAGGTCPAAPITLAAGASCTLNVVYQPVSASNANGSVIFGGAGVNTQTVLLAGATAAQGTTSIVLTESKVATLSGESVTFTATLSVAGAAGTSPTGSITFYNGMTALSTSPIVNGMASLSTALPDGTQTITAVYTGSASFAGSTSAAIPENVADYTLALNAGAAPTVEPGHSIGVPLVLNAVGAAGLSGSISLAAANLPPGLSVTFTPATVSLNSGQIPFTMNVIAAPAGQAALHGFPGFGTGGIMLAFLLLPVIGRRRRARALRPLTLMLLAVGGGLLLTGLTGCGSGTGFFGQQQKTYTVNVTATATDSTGGALTRSVSIPVTVE